MRLLRNSKDAYKTISPKGFVRTLLPLVALSLISTSASAQLMTVGQLKEMLSKGPQGELAATAYVQGVVDGMLGMESLHNKERGTPFEFCRLHDAKKNGKQVRHPAQYTPQLVSAWEKERKTMDTLAVDMVLSFLSSQYSCRQGEKR